jgi:hypothetical protein
VTAIEERTAPPVGPTAGARRRVAVLVGALAAAWLVPWTTHLVGVDWLLVPAVAVGVAGLLRGGRGVLDRLVLASALVVVATLVAALGFSVWPWHLHPVALGGLGLSVPVIVSAGLGRPWRLPRWVRSDTLVAVPAGLFAAAMCWPFARRDLADRLALMLAGEDGTRHFVMYDTVRRVGGYLFLHRAEAVGAALNVDLTYPPGAHLLTAVLDNLVTSSAGVGDAAAGLERFLWYQVGAYAVLGLAVLWAARRVAGPAATVPSFAPVAGAVVAYLLFGDMITAFLYGYLPEILGLAFLAVLVALAARPLARTREQVAVVTALVVAIGFTYYVVLPVAGVVVLAHAWWHRRRLRRHPWFTAALVALGAPLALLVWWINTEDQSADLLVQRFGILPVRLGPVLALGLLVVAAGAARSWRRSATARVTAVAGLVVVAVTAAIALVQLSLVGHTVYFFHKFLHAVVVVLLVGLGGVVPPLAGRLDRHRRPAALVAAAALAALPVAALGGFTLNASVNRGGSWGVAYLRGTEGETGAARAAVRAFREVPPAPGPVLVFYPDGRADVHASMSLAALRRSYGTNWPAFQWLQHEYTMDRLPDYLRAHPGAQVITTNPDVLATARTLPPELGLSIVNLR